MNVKPFIYGTIVGAALTAGIGRITSNYDPTKSQYRTVASTVEDGEHKGALKIEIQRDRYEGTRVFTVDQIGTYIHNRVDVYKTPQGLVRIINDTPERKEGNRLLPGHEPKTEYQITGERQ
jgi:hypothetical protein